MDKVDAFYFWLSHHRFWVHVYCSPQKHTRAMAEAVAKGARTVKGVRVKLLSVEEAKPSDVLAADAICIGSPVYNANVAPPIQEFINNWPFEGDLLRDKLGTVFISAGGISAGEELTQLSIIHSMLIFGMIVVGGPDWKSAFGASAIVEENPFSKEQKLDGGSCWLLLSIWLLAIQSAK